MTLDLCSPVVGRRGLEAILGCLSATEENGNAMAVLATPGKRSPELQLRGFSSSDIC